jgi:hypothetical protein
MQYVRKWQTIVISKEQLNKVFISLSDLFATDSLECVEISPKVEMTMQYVRTRQRIVISKEQLNKVFLLLSDLFATEKSHIFILPKPSRFAIRLRDVTRLLFI